MKYTVKTSNYHSLINIQNIVTAMQERKWDIANGPA